MTTSTSVRRQRMKIIGGAVLVVVGFGLFAKFGGHIWKESIGSLPAPALLLCLALLPLTGFPVSLILVAIGARFGFWQGLAAAAMAIPVHLALSYPLSSLFRRPITALVEKAGWRLPELDSKTAWPFTTWLAFVPGVSYALKNYTPPLAGVRFWTYFAIFYPVHLCTAILGLAVGGATIHFSWPLAAGIVTYGVAIGFLTKTLAGRLRSHDLWRTTTLPHGMQGKPA